MASVFIASRTGLAQLPAGASWREIYGVALLCGIGFTMSFFIGLLAFADAEREAMTKIAVLAGSLISAFAGAAVLLPAQSCCLSLHACSFGVPVEPVEALQCRLFAPPLEDEIAGRPQGAAQMVKPAEASRETLDASNAWTPQSLVAAKGGRRIAGPVPRCRQQG